MTARQREALILAALDSVFPVRRPWWQRLLGRAS